MIVIFAFETIRIVVVFDLFASSDSNECFFFDIKKRTKEFDVDEFVCDDFDRLFDECFDDINVVFDIIVNVIEFNIDE